MKSIIIQLANYKEFGPKFETTEAFWNEVDEIIDVLQSDYDFTINMQKIGYGLSDFYIGWLRVKKNLERFVIGEFNLYDSVWISTISIIYQNVLFFLNKMRCNLIWQKIY